MLERGQLGKTERGDFLGELEERAQALLVSGEEARAEGKVKRAAKLGEAAEKVEAKAAAVRAIQSIELKAKHGKAMATLRKELREIAKLEGAPTGAKAAKAGGSAAPAPGDGFTAVGGGKRGGKGKVNSSRAKAKSANPFDLLP